MKHSAKHTAKLTLTKRTVDTLRSEGKPWIARDDRSPVSVSVSTPQGAKSFV